MTKPPDLHKPVVKIVEKYLSEQEILNLIGGCYFWDKDIKKVGKDEKGFYIRWEEEI